MGALLDKCNAIERYTAGIANPPGKPDPAKVADRLYTFLNTLDSKASALMAFDGILGAAAAIVIEKGPTDGVLQLPVGRGLRIAVFVASLIAAAVCLRVTRLSYDFLGKLDPSSKDAWKAEFSALEAEIEKRTSAFRYAWWISVACVVWLPLSLVFRA